MREVVFLIFSVFSAISFICSFLAIRDKNNLGSALGCVISTIVFLVSAILCLVLF